MTAFPTTEEKNLMGNAATWKKLHSRQPHGKKHLKVGTKNKTKHHAVAKQCGNYIGKIRDPTKTMTTFGRKYRNSKKARLTLILGCVGCLP